MLTNTTGRITCDQVIKVASRITESAGRHRSALHPGVGTWVEWQGVMAVLVGPIYKGIIPCPAEKYFIHQVSLLIPKRTSKVVLTRRGDDEPVVMTTHGGWLSDVINPQSICCDLHASSSYFLFQGCENEDILKILP